MWLRMASKTSRYTQVVMPYATGKTWQEWVSILDADNKSDFDKVPLAHYLIKEHHVDPVWAQTIAKQYVHH